MTRSSADVVAHVLAEVQKDLDKHAAEISSTKKAVFQIERTLAVLEANIKPLMKLAWVICFGVLASVGTAVMQLIFRATAP